MSFVIEGMAPYLHNIGPGVITILCLIWLGYRAFSLLIIPVDQVIRLLNLDIPATPNITLDAVTSESISLHWQVPDKQSVSKHLIQLNGEIIGESDKKDTNVIVTGLTPDQLYCIRVIALNTQRLHTASEIIRIRTKPRTQDSTDESHDHVPVIQTHPPPNDPPPLPMNSTQSRHRLPITRETPVRRLSNAAKAERSRSNSFSFPQQQPQYQHRPSTPPTLESLTQELDRVNREAAELTTQLDQEEEKNRAEITKLESELGDLRARRKEDDDSKAGIKAKTKTLEERKRSVDAQKSKLDKTLRSVQDELAKLECEASARLRDLAEKEHALADLCEQTANTERLAKEARTSGREELSEVQHQITALEESNRLLAQRITMMKNQAETRNTDEDKSRIRSIDEREDMEDRKIDQEWIESENALKARQDQIMSRLDEANREFREALAMLVHARELHTVAHNPPSGKHRTKKRSRRTRQKALNMIGQPNSSSPSLVTNDPSISAPRPTSITLLPSPEVGMFYPEFHDPSMLPHEHQTSSPWASTHSLGMIHDVPLPLSTNLDRERLASGALLSPSVSEHLLPSNLFGPDEDSIRTSPYIDQLLQSPPTTSLPVSTPRILTRFPPIAQTADSPISEMSTRSSFSSPNQSLPTLPLYSDRTHSSPTIIMTPALHYPSDALKEEEVEVSSPAELNGIPLSAESAENSDEEIPIEPNESTSALKYWKIPSISFKRKAIPPEKRLPMLGTLKGEKSRSMPRTSASATPIGFNRPRSGSGNSSGWLQNVTRARAPSETGRQFDTNFDPLESRRLLEGAGVVHHHSALANPVDFSTSPRASFDSRSSMSRRSTDTDMGRLYPGGGYYRGPTGVFSDISGLYGWPGVNAPLSLPTSPAGFQGRWSPPNTSRSSLDPKAPEFRTSLQQQFLAPEPGAEATDVSPKRGVGIFALSRKSTVKQGDSFLNNFTGLFRRENKIGEDEDNDLARPKSQDTQASGEPSVLTSGSVEDLPSAEPSPEKKKKEKKKKDKVKGKSIFRWDTKADSTEDPELTSSKSLESIKAVEEVHEIDESAQQKKKKKRGKKGVKFAKENGGGEGSAVGGQETGLYHYQGRDVTLDEVPVSN